MKQSPLVLMVDDQPDNLYMYTHYFRSQTAMRVVTAPNGAEALLKAKRFKPDLILLDIAMPEMDGYEVLSALEADPATQGIPVILVSAHASPEEVKARVGSHFHNFVGDVAKGYITKPCLPNVLLKHVQDALGRTAERRA